MGQEASVQVSKCWALGDKTLEEEGGEGAQLAAVPNLSEGSGSQPNVKVVSCLVTLLTPFILML